MSHISDTLHKIDRIVLGENVSGSGADRDAFRSILRIVLRRFRLFVTVALGVFSLVVAVVLCLPKKYQAEIKLLVKNDRQDALITPQANANILHSDEVSESRVNSEIELIRSSDVLRQVVLRTKLAAPIDGNDRAAAEKAVEKAMNRLNKNLDVIAVKKADVIQVSYTNRSPVETAQVLKTLADVYLQKHLAVHGAPGMYNFFDEQGAKYRQRLAEAETELRQLREHASSWVSPDEKESLVQQALEAEQSLESVEADVADHRRRLATSVENLKQLESRIVTTVHEGANQSLEGNLVQTLTDLQNKRSQMVMKFLPEDRLVRELDEEIAQTSVALDAARKVHSVDRATDINPVRQNAEKDLIAEETTVAGLVAKRDRLQGIVNDYHRKLYAIAGLIQRNDDLSRNVREFEDSYLLYRKKSEEARIAEALDHQRVANVSLAEAAFVPETPSSPNIPIDLIAGFLVSLLVATAFVIVAESTGPAPSNRPETATDSEPANKAAVAVSIA